MTDNVAADIFAEIIRAQHDGPPVLVATLLSGPEGTPVGAKVLVRTDGSTLGTLGSPALDEAIVSEAGDPLRPRGVRTLYVTSDGRVSTRTAAPANACAVMVEVHERPARLVIAGGGHIGKALVTMATLCGFRVTVIDDRPEYANQERFPEADEVIRGRFDEVLSDYSIDSSSYVVCVTRGHRQDQVSLGAVIGRGAAYVGMIGSKRRAHAVLHNLRAEGADPDALAAVHTPIGLDIGAETPEEIAVAIMGEIIQVRRGG
jgi:xanthine dehydrogenase accessory factor